ncbi:MAG: hypothetical protein WC374_04275 [Phycisphaerae bacterium]
MSEHWQLFLALMGVVAAWGVLIVTIINVLITQSRASLKAEVDKEIKSLVNLPADCRRVEMDLMKLKADLPADYVRREDFIRFDVGINDKLDKLRDLVQEKDERIDNLKDSLLEKIEEICNREKKQ